MSPVNDLKGSQRSLNNHSQSYPMTIQRNARSFEKETPDYLSFSADVSSKSPAANDVKPIRSSNEQRKKSFMSDFSSAHHSDRDELQPAEESLLSSSVTSSTEERAALLRSKSNNSSDHHPS